MLEVKGITIHNTGNRLSAEENYNYLKYSGKLNLCHFLVDEKQIIQTIELNEQAYHTGKGYDYGNTNTIAVEICRSTANLGVYMKAQHRAIRLIKALCKRYGLCKYDIYFHRDFDRTSNCPHRILEIYKTKKNFLKEEIGNEL